MPNGLYADTDCAAQSGGKPMIPFAKEFLSYCQHRKSQATYKTYRSALWSFIDGLPNGIKPAEVQPVHIEAFLQRIAARHKISTANTEITERIYVHLQNEDLRVTDCLQF